MAETPEDAMTIISGETEASETVTPKFEPIERNDNENDNEITKPDTDLDQAGNDVQTKQELNVDIKSQSCEDNSEAATEEPMMEHETPVIKQETTDAMTTDIDSSKPDGMEDSNEGEADDVNPEDLEDGELSSDDGNDAAATIDTEGVTSHSHTSVSASTSDVKDEASESMPAPDVPAKRKRQSTESSEDMNDKDEAKHKEQGSTESSSSSEEDSHRSEKKRRKKEKARKKKEKKQKRKQEKREKEERKKRRRHGGGHNEDDYEDGYDDRPPPPPYADDGYGYDDRPWRRERQRTYSDERAPYDDRPPYDDYHGYGRSSPAGPYDSPPPDPYASPPDDSSDDEFSETLYSMVGDELMDPNVSAAEKEAMFKKKQGQIPGLSASKMKKMLKKRRWKDQMASREREQHRRQQQRSRRDDMPREKTQKCKFYAEGKCQKGERCQFSHNFIPAKKMEACKFFLQGYCAKGDMCIYLHSEVPCKYYHTGQKCFNADKCKFSHEPLTDSTKPLLEKAILLEETGTFKPEARPSLLGSPPKEIKPDRDRHRHDRSDEGDNFDDSLPPPKVSTFDPDDDVKQEPRDFNHGERDEDMRRPNHRHNRDRDADSLPPPLFGGPPSGGGGAMSLFSINVTPSADLQQKLDAGLYEELTAPLSESDDDHHRRDRYDSPPKRPRSFYSDTLVTPERHRDRDRDSRDRFTSDDDAPRKRNRWGPDLPPTNEGRDRRGEGEGRGSKGGLLPLPPPETENSTPSSTSQQAQATQQALSKILNALRHGAAAATANSTATSSNVSPRANDPRAADPRAADPRAAPARSDPRMRDPRAAQPLLPDPRGAMEEPSDPPLPVYDPRADPRSSVNVAPVRSNSPLMEAPPPVKREPLLPAPPITKPPITKPPIPELNGKFTREMVFTLREVDVSENGSYIPPGAENSQELLRDPRIKKRVQSNKTVASSGPPSLPDITADLQRMQNAMIMSNAAPITTKADKSRLSRSSIDSVNADPRRTSADSKISIQRGQGDQANTSEPVGNNNKPRNAPRTMYSKVNTEQPPAEYSNSASMDDDEDEDSLKIDMPEAET